MKSTLTGTCAVSAALFIAGCGGSMPAAENSPGQDIVASGVTPVPQAVTPAEPALAMPPSWMPADWDRNVYPGSGEPLTAEGAFIARQNMLRTVPFTLWAVAHDTLVTEAFEPIWVWYTAVRSCERGIQMSEDLASEFGNRERGKAALVQARNDLKAWATKQPPEMTLYFTANLGQWNEVSSAFPLQQLGNATTMKPQDVGPQGLYLDGAHAELWSNGTDQALNHFQASLIAPQCASKDKTKVYKFQRMSQWWVIFGDVDRGMGGLPNYKSREMLPAIRMTREQAAALAQRNPQRKVEVAVTFAPVGSSFVKGVDQSAIRAKLRQVTITDALDDVVLASKTY